MDLPEWAVLYCREHLGSVPAALLHRSRHMSEVLGLRLADGREVAVKARPDQNGREAACVEVQRTLAEQGFPCALGRARTGRGPCRRRSRTPSGGSATVSR
jgi:hypothetical protein